MRLAVVVDHQGGVAVGLTVTVEHVGPALSVEQLTAAVAGALTATLTTALTSTPPAPGPTPSAPVARARAAGPRTRTRTRRRRSAAVTVAAAGPAPAADVEPGVAAVADGTAVEPACAPVVAEAPAGSPAESAPQAGSLSVGEAFLASLTDAVMEASGGGAQVLGVEVLRGEALRLLDEGLSDAQVCARLGVSRARLLRWDDPCADAPRPAGAELVGVAPASHVEIEEGAVA